MRAHSQLEIHIVDPGEPGQGVHDQRQPEHLVTNNSAGTITMFPPATIGTQQIRPPGPSLSEWARLMGYRRFPTGYCKAGDAAGETIGDNDYLPRRLLGEYLTWYYDHTVASLPKGVRVTHHRVRAADLEILENGSYVVVLEIGFRFESDFVFIATGHGTSPSGSRQRDFHSFVRKSANCNARLLYISDPYPMKKLAEISPQAVVAIQGLGLSAYDVIAELTVGRGGLFFHRCGKLIYRKSGHEPRMLLFSRSGVPFSARGINQKSRSRPYEARFFTREVIAAKRTRESCGRGFRQLDFEQELLPLLILEMAYVYRATTDGVWADPKTYVAEERDLSTIESLLCPLQDRSFANVCEYRQFFLNYMTHDLEEAAKGNVDGPIKAAAEVIRASLQCLRLSVEHNGLTPESHRRFIEYYVPMMNRLTLGPPAQRNYELLALLEAGVVDLAGGPGSIISTDADKAQFVVESRFSEGLWWTRADVLINARVAAFHPDEDSSQLFQNLLARRLVRSHCNGFYRPGGLDIDRCNHAVDADGNSQSTMWLIGYPVEGPNYFTTSLPLPGVASRHIADADMCAIELFGMLEGRGP